jgi:hypothetical protein
MWSLTLGIWFSTGFGWLRESSFGFYNLVWGVVASCPLWLPALSLRSSSMLAKVVRLTSFTTLAAFFAILGEHIAERIVFRGVGHSTPTSVVLGNLLLFRLPFILAFLSTLLLGGRVWKDLNRWRTLGEPS